MPPEFNMEQELERRKDFENRVEKDINNLTLLVNKLALTVQTQQTWISILTKGGGIVISIVLMLLGAGIGKFFK